MGETTRESVIIRPATRADANFIYHIGTHCFTDAWKKETVMHDLEQPLSHYWVAESDQQVIAFACFWLVVDELQLVNIAVEAPFRRQGIAKKLLDAGIKEAKEYEIKTMFLEVRVSNEPAQIFYKKQGLSIVALRKDVYQFPKEDGYIMTKVL